MRHKTVERLIERVQKSIETQRRAQPDMESNIRAIAHYRKRGFTVWSVEYDTNCWYLYHYNLIILSYNEQTGKVNEWIDRVSVSDQQGMNGFLNALGVKHYISRAGRTARYV